jgi:branched-subunit amino acid aminotransferase/4-amino-4-deoxychorismate lyase
VITEVLINGAPSDGLIPVTDSSVLRGDGCFEVLKSYEGHVFALDEHLDRLAASATALKISLPDRTLLASWIEKTAVEVGSGAVRVVVTRGSGVPGLDDPSNVIVFGHTWDVPKGPVRLLPVVAPWHAAGVPWELAGAKVISYGPNMAAARRSKSEGFDDALLLTVESVILEGPTFSVAWVVDGTFETPGLELGILDSITRRFVLDLARDAEVPVVEGTWDLQRLDAASEVMALSTIREVQSVVAVGGQTWQPGPITERLARSFARRTLE